MSDTERRELTAAELDRVLRDDELDQVDGGIIAILIGLLVPAPPPVIHGLL
jgi:hypothetical protein